MAMTMDKFINALNGIQKALTVDGLAELISFAADKYCDGTTDAMDALIATAIEAGWRGTLGAILRELKIMEYARLTKLDKAVEYKGIYITYRLKSKGKAADHQTGAELTGKEVKEALRFQMELASDLETVEEAIRIVRIAKEVEREQKKKETAERKQTAAYWSGRINRLITEAEKHGFRIEGRLVGTVADEVSKRLTA